VPVGGFAGSASSARTRAATRARSPPRQPMPAMPERPTGVTLGPVGLLAARAGSAVDNGTAVDDRLGKRERAS
jgi:hypothetical protein